MSKIDQFNDHTYVGPDYFEYLRQVEKALAGDIILSVTPATPGSSAAAVATAIAGAAGKFVRTVKFELKDAASNIHTWFNGKIDLTIAETTVGTGVAAIAGSATSVTLTEGVGSINIEYTGVWAAADTSTLTTTQRDIVGVTIAAKTSKDTLVA
ncbi:MAG: hypothetical protein K0R34_2789 [Herbinix sp.]|jgi:hypothetical protein|nr:hypothetical protein [Herbinix sp.]